MRIFFVLFILPLFSLTTSCKRDFDVEKLKNNPYDRDYVGPIWFSEISSNRIIDTLFQTCWSRGYLENNTLLKVTCKLNESLFTEISPSTIIMAKDEETIGSSCRESKYDNNNGKTYFYFGCQSSSFLCSEFSYESKTFIFWKLLSNEQYYAPSGENTFSITLRKDDSIGSSFNITVNY
jgi:hypothetical protein